MFKQVTGMFCLLGITISAHASDPFFVHIKAKDKYERSKIASLGVSIEAVYSDSIYGLASKEILKKLEATSFKPLESFPVSEEINKSDFPDKDERFHNYAELTKALDDLVAAHPNLMSKSSIGNSLEGKKIWAVQLNTSNAARQNADPTLVPAKPGIVFMGNHHAREHLSAEIPLMILEFLANNYGVDKDITALLEKRDIYFIPMVNPDGVEFDIKANKYKWHRKNMRPNGSSNPGVDLNRNYGYMWNHGGSSKDSSSDVYMGPEPFSEPETQAVRDFVEAHSNLNVLLSFHTFSELILYPWGHTHDAIDKSEDLESYVAMATKMANWNHYKAEQSSELYIASGDTTDWSYGTKGIFSFTFELSPKDMWRGGFYPGARVIDKVFEDNLRPALYLIELADDPRRSRQGFDPRLSWLD